MVLIKSKSFFTKHKILIRKNRKVLEMIRQGYSHFDSRKNRKYASKTDIELLSHIKKQSRLD